MIAVHFGEHAWQIACNAFFWFLVFVFLFVLIFIQVKCRPCCCTM